MPEPSLRWWWRVDHRGHRAFYMRTLMPGDFAPGRLPLERHVRGPVACATCGASGETGLVSEDLVVVERSTGQRNFLDGFRARRTAWPPSTDPSTCHLCSGRGAPADRPIVIGGSQIVQVCARCAPGAAAELDGLARD